MGSWAACWNGEDWHPGPTRADALAAAMEDLVDRVACGDSDAGEYMVEIGSSVEWHTRCCDEEIEDCDVCGLMEDYHDAMMMGRHSEPDARVLVRRSMLYPDGAEDFEWVEVANG